MGETATMLMCMKHADYPPDDCDDCRDEQRLKLYPELSEAARHLVRVRSCLDYRGLENRIDELEIQFAIFRRKP